VNAHSAIKADVGNVTLPTGSPPACIDAMIEARCVIAGALGAIEALVLADAGNTALVAAHARLVAAHRQPLFQAVRS